jgi:hypothetical protein
MVLVGAALTQSHSWQFVDIHIIRVGSVALPPDAAGALAQSRSGEAADRNISAPSKELRAARESGLGALVFNRLWELRHTNTRRIFNHTRMHQHFPLKRHPFAAW